MDGNNKVSIVTHSSGFHTDDVFAVATLSLILEKEGKEFTITRSRDVAVAEAADYLVDFGWINDPDTNRFDHHQVGKAGERANGIPYASFGLVWKKFGVELCGSEAVANKIDKRIVQPIDASDNGIDLTKNLIEDISPFSVSSMVHLFYPTWKEEDKNIDDIFIEVVSYAKFLLSRVIKFTIDEYEAESFVLEAYNKSMDKRVIVVESNRYPWGDVLSKFPEPLFAIYRSLSGDNWNMKCVRDDGASYVCRKYLPESWAGKANVELEKITGVLGAKFCHTNRFVAAATTKEGILKMAEIALNS